MPVHPNENSTLDAYDANEGEPGTDALVSALQEYRKLLDEGQLPDRREFLRQHPQIADGLAECLDSLDFLQNVAPQLSQRSDPGEGLAINAPTLHAAIGDFRIIREIGRGGMGVVYEAEQLSLARRVALKVLPFAAVLDQRQLQRFKNEALAAAHLDHPHIVDVLGVGCDRGVHYYAMRYIEGHTLAQVIEQLKQQKQPHAAASRAPTASRAEETQNSPVAPRDGVDPSLGATNQGNPIDTPDTKGSAASHPSDANTKAIASISTRGSVAEPHLFRTVARLAAEVAEALDHAHQQGVVHRDIKPSNLIIDLQGKPWITDFGLAQMETNQTLTITGDLIGTLRYMSPEQVLAKRVPIDHRTDIYSLGVSLYELITLRQAFSGDERQELLRKIAFDDPPPLRRTNRSVPVELNTILMKAMAKNPDERYGTAGEMADDLRRFLADKPILARRPSWFDRGTKWARRHRTAVLWAMISLGVISIVSSMALVRMAGALRRAEVAEDQLRDEKDSAEDRETQARRSEQIWSLLYRARGIRTSGWSGHRTDSLKVIREAAEVLRTMPSKDDYVLELRNESIACLALTDLRPIRRLASAKDARSYVSGDGMLRRYAYISAENAAIVRKIDDDEEVFRTAADPRIRFAFPILSPNGRYLLIADQLHGEWTIWDVERGNKLKPQPVPYDQSSIDISPDSCWLAYGGSDARLRLVDLTSTTPATPQEHVLKAPPAFIKMDYDGARTAVCFPGETSVEILYNHSDTPPDRFSAAPAVASEVAFHPFGKQIAVGGLDGKIHVWDSQTKKKIHILTGHDAAIVGLGYNHTGDWLFSVSHDRTSLFWDVRTGRPLVRTAGFVRVLGVASNSFVLQQSPHADLCEIIGGHEYRTVPGRLGAFSRDGSMLASLGSDIVEIHDVNDLKVLVTLPMAARFVDFSAGDRELFVFSAQRGVFRWPIGRNAKGQINKIGPPDQISRQPITEPGDACVSHNGRHLAWVTGERSVTVVDLLALDKPLTITTSEDVTAIALHPDGRQLAVNSWNMTTGESYGYEIWDLASRSKVKHLPGEGGSWWAKIGYSHDGKWLVTGPDVKGSKYTQWKVDAWEDSTQFPGASGIGDFSPDDRVFAIDDLQRNERVVRLIDSTNHREFGVLEAHASRQHHLFFNRICYSGDGGRLAVGDSAGIIHLWDLQRIRKELSSLGLDWDRPPYPELPEATSTPITVDVGNFFPTSKGN